MKLFTVFLVEKNEKNGREKGLHLLREENYGSYFKLPFSNLSEFFENAFNRNMNLKELAPKYYYYKIK